jgi:hypothetical protein
VALAGLVPGVLPLAAAVLGIPVRPALVLPGRVSRRPVAAAAAGAAVGPMTEGWASRPTTAGLGWLHGPIAAVPIVIRAVLTARRNGMVRRTAAMPSCTCPAARTQLVTAQLVRPLQVRGLIPTDRTAARPASWTTPRDGAHSPARDATPASTDRATTRGLTRTTSGQAWIHGRRISETAAWNRAGIHCGCPTVTGASGRVRICGALITATGASGRARIRGALVTATGPAGRVPNRDGLPRGTVAAAFSRCRTRPAGHMTPGPPPTVPGRTWIRVGRHMTAIQAGMLTERVGGASR